MKKILLLRPEPDATQTAQHIKTFGFHPVINPLFTTEFLHPEKPQDSFQALFVTSKNALRAMKNLSWTKDIFSLQLFTVGDETAEEAKRLGFQKILSANGSAADLAAFIATKLAPQHGPVLYCAGVKRKNTAEAILRAKNFDIGVCEVYDMASKNLQDSTLHSLQNSEIEGVVLTSQRTAERFFELAVVALHSARKLPQFFCLSEDCAEPLKNKGFQAKIAAEPTLKSLLNVLKTSLN